ncbi:MAG: hypothetical protein AAB436_00330 [Patescibacteria group bacterium]
MSALYINKQTEAEKDDFLFECFHDTGVLDELASSSYTILTGRKGSGKTAAARYLEKNTKKYSIDFAYRLSVRNFNTVTETSEKDKLASLLSYIAIKSAQKMLNTNYLDKAGLKFWKDFLLQNGLQQLSDYETYAISRKTNKKKFSIKAVASYLIAKGEANAGTEHESVKERTTISDSPSALYDALKQTVNKDKEIIILIDDLSDYLDESDEKALQEDINIIKDLLLSLQTYNLAFREEGVKIRFVSLVRADLFSYMSGSNINKLVSDSLELQWDEKSFSSLLIKRMPYFASDLDHHLKDPVQSLKDRFPDEIFADYLKDFTTNRYESNFYAYMAAISFNRPRDFLQFCYAMRNRLSLKHPATFENINSAEIEYTDYFIQELRDELYIASRVFHYDLSEERLNQLIELLSQRNGFNAPQLRSDLGKFLGTKTSIGKKKIEILLSELWRYGVVGVTEDKDKIIRFKYLSDTATFTPEMIKKYTFYLHRGLWWFTRKKKHSREG